MDEQINQTKIYLLQQFKLWIKFWLTIFLTPWHH